VQLVGVKGGGVPPSRSDAGGALDAGRLPSMMTRAVGQGRLVTHRDVVCSQRYVRLLGLGWTLLDPPGPGLAVCAPAGRRPALGDVPTLITTVR
jgi:hypothetical protein